MSSSFIWNLKRFCVIIYFGIIERTHGFYKSLCNTVAQPISMKYRESLGTCYVCSPERRKVIDKKLNNICLNAYFSM